MKIRLLLLPALLLIAAQDATPVAITHPAEGDVLSGEVVITGTTDVPGFVSSQLEFSYASNSTDTWFALQSSSQPEVDSALAVWNTSLITDGDYKLRLRVYMGEETFDDVIVQVKVQNDMPILTPTPIYTSTPGQLISQLPTPFLVASSPTPTLAPRPSPTPFPTNAVSLDQTAIYTSLGRGALVIVVLFVFAGLVLRFRRY